MSYRNALFDPAAGQGRRYSLAGQSTARESREQVLARTHLAREKRRMDRERKESAICIQVCFTNMCWNDVAKYGGMRSKSPCPAGARRHRALWLEHSTHASCCHQLANKPTGSGGAAPLYAFYGLEGNKGRGQCVCKISSRSSMLVQSAWRSVRGVRVAKDAVRRQWFLEAWPAITGSTMGDMCVVT